LGHPTGIFPRTLFLGPQKGFGGETLAISQGLGKDWREFWPGGVWPGWLNSGVGPGVNLGQGGGLKENPFLEQGLKPLPLGAPWGNYFPPFQKGPGGKF